MTHSLAPHPQNGQRPTSDQATHPNSTAPEANANGDHGDAPQFNRATRRELQRFALALFGGLTQTRATFEQRTQDELCELLTTHDIRAAKDGPLFSPTIYREGATSRKDTGVAFLTALVADCDESHTLAQLIEIIEWLGVFAIVYSTHRHGEIEKDGAGAPGERYRVVFLLEAPIAVEDWPAIWERFNLLFGGEIDRACKDPSRAYYLHSCPEGRQDKAVARVFEGRFITPDDLPPLPHNFDKPNFDAKDYAPKGGAGEGKPGDDFNARADNEVSAQVLEAAGCRVWRSESSVWKWKRPGKTGPGISGTIGHYGPGIVHVFTSNFPPLEARHAYRAFRLLALLEHNGDFGAAARQLARLGYGERKNSFKGTAKIGTSKTPKTVSRPPAEIPAPALTNERGQAEYTSRQIVEIVRPDWDVDALSTHAAHAARVREILGDDLRFCPELGWLGYGLGQWNKDDRHNTATAARAVKLSAQVREESALLFEASARLAKEGRANDAEAMARAASALLRHAKQAEAKTFVEGALHFAAGDADANHLRVKAAAFDQRPWLIGFQNGTWEAGVWREHRREDYLLHLSPVELDFDTDRSEWLTVLDRITGGDNDFARTLQDTAGYIFSGASHLRFLPWPYGPKGTGKSTFAELLHTALGGMAANIDPKKLQADSARERLGADLWNRRLAIVSEAGSQRLEAELLKTLSGSDALSVRFLYREAFDAPPRHVLLMVSNDAPRLDAYDDALRDRVVALPFVHRLDNPEPLNLTGGVRIEAVRQDPDSPLVRGFTAWAVEGMARVFETQSIYRAPCIGTATARFWADTDPLTDFWEELSLEHLSDISRSDLRKKYEGWCENEGARPMNRNQWSRACESFGLEDTRKVQGVRHCGLNDTRKKEVEEARKRKEESEETKEGAQGAQLGQIPESPRKTQKPTYGLSEKGASCAPCAPNGAQREKVTI